MKNVNRVSDNKVLLVLIIISVSVIVSGSLLPSLVDYFDRNSYFPVQKEISFDGAVSTTMYIKEEADIQLLVQTINDMFAERIYRSRLPEIYDPETGLPRIPMKMLASRPFDYEDYIEITWFYD